MTHSLHNAAPREALTDTIMAAKIRHNLTFDALAEGTGLSLA
ncbi:cyanate hydratase, partial [Serratia marcescens]